MSDFKHHPNCKAMHFGRECLDTDPFLTCNFYNEGYQDAVTRLAALIKVRSDNNYMLEAIAEGDECKEVALTMVGYDTDRLKRGLLALTADERSVPTLDAGGGGE